MEIKQPIGYICKQGWGGQANRAHIELHPTKDTTVQVTIDQNDGTIHINGFWRVVKHDASNAMTIVFN